MLMNLKKMYFIEKRLNFKYDLKFGIFKLKIKFAYFLIYSTVHRIEYL